MKRLPATATLLLLVVCAAGPAWAEESSFLFPQLGLGAGPAWIDGGSNPGVSCDFLVGYDWQLTGPFAAGYTAGFEFEGSQQRARREWMRFSLTSMMTGSIGYWDAMPFLRVGAGPSLAITQVARRPYTQVGLGLTAEAATGFRSIVELYAQATAVFDPAEVSGSAMVGVRLNAWIADLLFGHHH